MGVLPGQGHVGAGNALSLGLNGGDGRMPTQRNTSRCLLKIVPFTVVSDALKKKQFKKKIKQDRATLSHLVN